MQCTISFRLCNGTLLDEIWYNPRQRVLVEPIFNSHLLDINVFNQNLCWSYSHRQILNRYIIKNTKMNDSNGDLFLY